VRPLAKIGYYSYSIYLWHGWVCSLRPQGTLVSMLGCILAAVLLGALIGKVIEYPALALRDRLFPPPLSRWDRSHYFRLGLAPETRHFTPVNSLDWK
jgi:peptidoglycan/LPS O-acetylase OafA/YrhL